MRVLFFGNSTSSLPCLEALRRAPDVKLVGVVSPASRPKGLRDQLRRHSLPLLSKLPRRGGPLQQLHRAAAGLPHFLPENVNHIADELVALGADVVVMAGFAQILKGPLLRRLGPVLNIHPSLLPSYRGPVPCFWVVANGERRSGVTVHRVEEGIDTGPILSSAAVEVPPWLDSGSLRLATMRRGAALLLETLRRADAGGQSQSGGSYFGQIRPGDLNLPLDGEAVRAYDRARAAAPDRGVTITTSEAAWRRGVGHAWREPCREEHVTIELRDAELYPDYDAGAAGAFRKLPQGVLVACGKGCVLFRQARQVN